MSSMQCLLGVLLLATSLVAHGELTYPAEKRGGYVCVCRGSEDLPGSTCTPALLRNQPYRPTPLTSHFVDISPSAGSVGAEATITTVLAGTPLDPIVIEIVSRDDQLVAESVAAASVEFSSQLMGVPIMTSLQAEAATISGITIASVDDTTSAISIASTTIGSLTALQDGMFLISDLRLYASGLPTGSAVRVCLNISIVFDASVVGESTSSRTLWILLEAVEIRNSPLVGNTSSLFFPTFIHFPSLYSPILEVSWSVAQTIYGVSEVVMDTAIDDITMYVRDVTQQLTTSLDGQSMEVEGFYTSNGGEVEGLTGTRIVTIREGKAKFTGLGFDNTTVSRSGIQLTFSVPSSTSTQSAISPSLVAVNVPEFAFRLRFSAGSFLEFDIGSYDNIIQTLGSPTAPAFKAVLGVALPVIEVQVIDSSGNVDTNTDSGLFIVAKCVGAEIEAWSSVAPVLKGEARFSGLTFSGFPTGVAATKRLVIVTFQLSTSADPTGTISAARLVLYSPIVEVFDATSARTPSQMRYSTSRPNAAIPVQQEGFVLLTTDTQLRQSVRVDVLAEDGWPVSLAGVEVGLELEGGDGVGGALAGTLRVPASSGIAEFNDVAVVATSGGTWRCFASNATSCPAVSLKATLYNSGTLVQPLLSTSVYLIHKSTSTASTSSTTVDTDDTSARDRLGVRSKLTMRFEPSGSSLFTAEDQATFATVRVVLPPIMIEVLDSTGAVDTSANSLTIVASAGSIPLNGAVATTLKGRAVFASLLFADSGTTVLTFTCGTTRSGDPVEGTSLVSGAIVVEATVAATYGLTFHRDSSVQGQAQTVFGALGYPLPIIGVSVVDSAHIVAGGSSASVIDIIATMPGGTFDPSSVVEMAVVEGTAWFTNLILDSVVSGAGSRAITFTAQVNLSRAETQTVTLGASSIAVKDLMAYVHNKNIATGSVVLVDPSEITDIEIVPYYLTSTPLQGHPTAMPIIVSNDTIDANGTQYPVVGSRANTLLASRQGGTFYQPLFPASVGFSGTDIAAAFSTVAAAPKGSVVEIAVWMRNAASRLTLPDSATQQNISITASGVTLVLGGASGSFPLDPRPSGDPIATPIRLTFSDLTFVAERYVVGQYATLTFTAPDAKVGSVLQERPLLVSPVVVEGSAPDSIPDLKVILVEVYDGGTTFDSSSWAVNLALAMNIPSRRIELLKVRQGASATSEFDRAWSGTRMLLQFLPPTPEDEEKLSSNQLTQLLLSLSPASCGSVAPLKIRRKLLLEDDSECDLHVLDEQRRAAQRCVSTSGQGDRCTCFSPMFDVLGPKCKKTSQMLAVCATLRACGRHDSISEPCLELTYLIYVQYALIGVYTLIALGVLYAIYLWRSGKFKKLKRTRLGDNIRGKTTASLRMVSGEEDPNSMMI